MKQTITKLLIGILLFAVFCIGIALYLTSRTVSYVGSHSPTTGHTATVILIDGLSQEYFKTSLDNGRLPNIQKLIQSGTYIENGISSFPSMTGYAFYPFITGHDAVESGIIGLRWFDRARDKGNLRNYVGRTNVWMNQDITDTIQTFFESSEGQYTSSINSYMNRGVADSKFTGWTHTTAKFEGKGIFSAIKAIPIAGAHLAKNHYQHESEVMEMAISQLKQNPKLQWVTLPSPDATIHVNGMTDEYTNLLHHIDSLIGILILAIQDEGQSEDRMIAILTDHGIATVKKNIDFISEAKSMAALDLERGNAVNYTSMLLDTPLEKFVDLDGHFVINGNLCAMLYLRDPHKNGTESWRTNLPYGRLIHYTSQSGTIDIPKQISKIDGVDLLIYRTGKDIITIRKQEELATITIANGSYRYETEVGDPLGYSDISLGDTLMTANQWLKATINTKYPDALHRIVRLMDSPVVGDLVLTSKVGYDFASDYEAIVGNYRGGHGGLEAGQLRVPYVLSIPSREAQIIPYLRSEEVGKLIGDWLAF